MTLNQLLDPQNNNLDFFRVVAALLVIYGHAPGFVVDSTHIDIIYGLLRFDYSGSLGVKFFFLLSGLLVTHSLLAQTSLGNFLLRRTMRIFPGLITCLCITIFFIGPIFTQLELDVYFTHHQTWLYLLHNTILYPLKWQLPGVFSEGKTNIVNGSLWTLPLEVMCYLSLVIFFVLILRRYRIIASLLLLTAIIIIFLNDYLWPRDLFKFKEALLLGGCFCIGSLAAIHQQKIPINWQGIAVGIFTLLLLWQTPLQQLVFYFVFFYVCLYLSGTVFFIKFLRLPGDPSYGIYIYGFVIQQCIANLLPEQGILLHQITAAIIAIGVGYLSWYLIEKPAISFGRKKLR